MKTAIVVLAVLGLSGCVVAPYRPYVAQPVPAQEVVYYPLYESAYIWDPLEANYFFIFGGRRYYMNRGWNYRQHGVPPGHYQHHR